jgi:DNA-binding MarR family transcriptional regulator
MGLRWRWCRPRREALALHGARATRGASASVLGHPGALGPAPILQGELAHRDERVYTSIMAYRDAARSMADECLCFRVRRVSRALTRLYDEALRPLEIQATQLTVLNAAALLEERDAPMGTLADVLAMDLTTLSRNLRPLEASGLLGRERSEADRRVRVVRLTAKGRETLEEALPLWEEAHARVVGVLGPELAEELKLGFDAAVAAADAAGAGEEGSDG